QASWAGEFKGPGKILGVALFVRIDEDEIEWREAFGGEPRECLACRADPHFDHVGKAGASDVEASDLSMFCLGFQCDQVASGHHSTRQPYGAISAQRSYFENSPCSAKLRQQHQQFAFV